MTVYRGHKLPPFYIGHSTVKRIENGYHGTISSKKYKSLYQSELVDNPHLFETRILSYHNSREEATEKETKLQRYVSAANNPLYMNQAIFHDNFFLGPKGWKKGRKQSIEANIKRSKTLKGRPSPNRGKKASEETKTKLRLARKNRIITQETREKQRIAQTGKIGATNGRYWVNNGSNEQLIYGVIPEGFIKGRLKK